MFRLGAGTITTAVVVPTVLASCSGDTSTDRVGTGTTIPVTGPGGTLTQPEVVASADGVLDVDLVARPATVDLGAGHAVDTWTYDGAVPGRTWEVQPGDTLKVHLANELSAPSQSGDGDHVHPVDMTRPHRW